MNTAAEKLACRVRAVNLAEENAVSLYNLLAPIFVPFIGQKILKADGTLLAKIQKLIPPLPNSSNVSVFRHVSNYSLAWTVKTCEFMPPHGCMYHELVLEIGKITGPGWPQDNNVLQSISPPYVGKYYTVEQILELRRVYAEAKEVASRAFDALYPFGEYDN